VVVAHRVRTAAPAPPQPVAVAATAGHPAAGASAGAFTAPAGMAPRRSPLAGESAARRASVPAPAASAPVPSTALLPQAPHTGAGPDGSSTGVQRVLSPASRQRRGGVGGSGFGAARGLASP
jgi:hypothetical protein